MAATRAVAGAAGAALVLQVVVVFNVPPMLPMALDNRSAMSVVKIAKKTIMPKCQIRMPQDFGPPMQYSWALGNLNTPERGEVHLAWAISAGDPSEYPPETNIRLFGGSDKRDRRASCYG
jgi:hypothetical protein